MESATFSSRNKKTGLTSSFQSNYYLQSNDTANSEQRREDDGVTIDPTGFGGFWFANTANAGFVIIGLILQQSAGPTVE